MGYESMSNYIFLDVDGVLNSSAYFDKLRDEGKTGECTELCDEYVQRLECICKKCNAKIVLASTWRHLVENKDLLASRMYEYLATTLERHGMGVYAYTPNLGDNRPKEIFDWIQKNCTSEDRYVILDDDFDFFDYAKYGLEDYLVHTEYFCNSMQEGGLQQEHVEKAIKILGR